jgi:hypothetical protein
MLRDGTHHEDVGFGCQENASRYEKIPGKFQFVELWLSKMPRKKQFQMQENVH